MIDTSSLGDFARQCKAASVDLKQYVPEAAKEAGEKFLDLVQANIEAAGNVDTRKLLRSFTRGGNGNIWRFSGGDGAITLTIGTNVEYARYVNYGHRQTPGRFVPGYMVGGRFRYQAGCSTGIVLKAKFVPGSRYFDKAIDEFKELLPEMMQKSFDQFFERYFS